MNNTVYKEELLDHYHHPRNKGSLSGSTVFSEGFNANCGDKIKIGLFISNNRIEKVRYEIRGCAICIASASMMSEHIAGRTIEESKNSINLIKAEINQPCPTEWPDGCDALTGAAKTIGRRKCILLTWHATEKALNTFGANED